MPVKGDDIATLTALTSLDHHGEDMSIGDPAVIIRGMVHCDVELLDAGSGMSYYGNAVEVFRTDLPAHTHGTALTVVSTGQVFKLQKTIKDDGYLKLIEVTR